MRHVIDADDVENEISEELRKCKIGEKSPSDLTHEIGDVQHEPTPNRHTPATDRL